jgi:hypothetical protein
MFRAGGQAEQYARTLSPDEGRPPFIVVVDVESAIFGTLLKRDLDPLEQHKLDASSLNRR